MLADGYAAVSSAARCQADAGVTPALVHYYFDTLDDLFLAVLRTGAQMRTPGPCCRPAAHPRAVGHSKDRAGTGLLMEFMALANHRKVIAVEIADTAGGVAAGSHMEALQGLIGKRTWPAMTFRRWRCSC